MVRHGGLATSPARLLATSIGRHAVGLGAVAIGPSAPVVVGGAMVFALGAGLMTLVRPYVVQAVFGTARGGLVNGRIARHQQLARAAGPLAVAWLAGVGSYTAVCATVAAMSAVLAVISYGVLVGTHPLERRDYDEANTGCA